MQKTLDILERNVQWLALGLGGILLIWSVYRYAVIPPASAKIGSNIATPDEVARLTAQGPVKALQEQIANQRAQPPSPLDLVTPFQGAMDRLQPPNDYFAVAFNVKTAGGIEGPTPDQAGGNRPQITAAAQLPPAKPGQPLTGLSVITRPVNLAANQNANAVQPVKAVTEDLAWVTVPFKISAAELKKAFQPALGAQPSLTTAVLEVVLQRQRALSEFGNNGPTFPADDQGIENVKSLRIYQPPVSKPMPSEQSPKPQKYDFLDWAQAHPDIVYQPAFYEVTLGDPWTSPLQQQENNAVQNATDQTSGTGTDAGGTTPDNSTQPSETTPGAAPQSQPAAQPAAGQQPAQPAPAGRPSYAPDDSDRPTGGYDPRSAYSDRGGRYGRGRMFGRGPQFGGPGNAGNGTGTVDPLNLPADLILWAHDETARPGQIYRYRVIYIMKNPLFGTTGIATPQLSDLLALTSPASEWTGPVTVPAKTKFWISAVRASNSSAYIDVFQWVRGNWKAQKVTVQPGDVVPGTQWALVDVHGGSDATSGERDKYVLLTNDAGELSHRYPKIDSSDQAYKDLQDQTNPRKETEQNPNAAMRVRGYRGYPPPGGRRPGR